MNDDADKTPILLLEDDLNLGLIIEELDIGRPSLVL